MLFDAVIMNFTISKFFKTLSIMQSVQGLYDLSVFPLNSFNIIYFQGPVVRKVDSAIHRIVIFSTAVKTLEKLKTKNI